MLGVVTGAPNNMKADTIIDYWFGATTGGFSDEAHRQRWFAPDAAADAEIRARFGHLIDAAAGGELDDWLASPRGTVAFVLLCDQFPRQVYRGTAQAYATDALALAVARRAIEAGTDGPLGFDERAFLYMPFQHAESRVDQHTAVGLFAALRDATPAGQRHLTGNFLRYAQQHRDIVLRFGRFPHRNGVLGRTSSSEELTFLKTASRFGQQAAPAADNPPPAGS
jgi:uncharacterized protein (DUF924 family)